MRRAPSPSGEGLFVVLEGIDGAGKSEQAQRLADWLRERGLRVVLTREPTDGDWGRRYRAWARGEIKAEPDDVLRFFVEDRREHVASVIAPARAAGDAVVCDRYVASTLAYQAAHGVSREKLREALAAGRFPAPDITLWLRLAPAQALERLAAAPVRPGVERYERLEFLERVDAEYARLGLVEIDASRSRDEVARDIAARVEAVL